MKYRNYFICFSAGFAAATSLLIKDAFIWNYLLFSLPMIIMAIAYLIAISKDTKQ